MNNYLAVTLGVLCAGLGGELFVRGAVDLGRWLWVPAALIGATSAASSPELAIALTAARAGTPEISLGDALGCCRLVLWGAHHPGCPPLQACDHRAGARPLFIGNV